MGCTYDDSYERAIEAKETKLYMERTTRVLCDVIRKLEEKQCLHWLSPEGQQWHKEHKATDAKRKKEEAAEKERRRLDALERIKAAEAEIQKLKSSL